MASCRSNSTDGRIVDTLDMFARLPTRITGKCRLRSPSLARQMLAGRSDRGQQAAGAVAVPRVAGKNLPQAKAVEMTSTAIAAQIAADKPGTAAIASLEAGMHYGLTAIDSNIEDNKHNLTRFAVIGGEPPHRTGRDKTALMFEIPHKPGSLADAMLVLAGPAESDVDRIVLDAKLEERVSVLRRTGRAPDGLAGQASRWKLCGERRRGWMCWWLRGRCRRRNSLPLLPAACRVTSAMIWFSTCSDQSGWP